MAMTLSAVGVASGSCCHSFLWPMSRPIAAGHPQP